MRSYVIMYSNSHMKLLEQVALTIRRTEPEMGGSQFIIDILTIGS